MFLYNPKSAMLHKKPATENCNLDDAKREFAITDLVDLDDYDLCSYCFKDGEQPFAIPGPGELPTE